MSQVTDKGKKDLEAQVAERHDVGGVGDEGLRSAGGGALAGDSPVKAPEEADRRGNGEEHPKRQSKNNRADFLTNIMVLAWTVVMGIYTTRSLGTAMISNDQSQLANQLALLALCATTNLVRYPSLFGGRQFITDIGDA
ncbi:MAG: hypothetical protein M1839_006938 [Geoglossum umbratile]|nr:MAG: hypothetical protein M1839_006938 [Geoglossum umbratile]